MVSRVRKVLVKATITPLYLIGQYPVPDKPGIHNCEIRIITKVDSQESDSRRLCGLTRVKSRQELSSIGGAGQEARATWRGWDRPHCPRIGRRKTARMIEYPRLRPVLHHVSDRRTAPKAYPYKGS